MIGQGSPSAPRSGRVRPRPGGAPRRLAALLCALCCAAAQAAEAADVSLRLRIEWGGGDARQWRGTIGLSAGELSAPRALGIEADTPGSMWIEQGKLRVEERSQRTYDGVDVTLVAPADAALILSLAPRGAAAPRKPVEVPLAELLGGRHQHDLDDGDNRLLVRRAAGDSLRLSFDAPSLVFATGETCRCELQPNLLGVEAGTKMRFEMELASVAGELLWSDAREAVAGEAEADWAAIPWEIELPKGEGVYTLHVRARTRGRLAWKQTVAERSAQLAVVAARPPTATIDRSTATAASSEKPTLRAEIDPANPSWWKRFGNVSLVPGLRLGPWGHGETSTIEHSLGRLLELPPAADGAEMAWQAYPLSIASPGEPHVLEVEYPSDVPQSLLIGIVEPNAAGAVAPLGVDSGVYRQQAADGPPRWSRHRLTFWPRTRSPVVLIANASRDAPAAFGKLRLLSSGRHLPVDQELVDLPSERLLAGYLDRPLFAENFSAPEALDEPSARSLDDWATFHAGGIRLVEHLRSTGRNGLMLSVLADGAAIYPSELLAATPRYDTGAYFSTGQDPLPKDVLELLLRLFDREGLQLIPALRFSTPLPELEAVKRRGGPQSVGLEWVGADGATWQDAQGTSRGQAPYYNVLHPRVQQAMLHVVRELAERYAGHPSLTGLALQLSADGYAVLPGAEWGFDDDTVARFAHDTGMRVPGDGPRRFAARAEFLRGPGREAWLEWRAARLADFYAEVARELTAAQPGARLYLAGAGLLDGAPLRHELRPALPQPPLSRALLELGLAPQLAQGRGNIVLLRPSVIEPLTNLTAQAVDMEFNQSAEVDRLFHDSPTTGSLLFHPPHEARLETFDAQGPFRKSFTWLLAQQSPDGDENRRRFAHSLATLDAQAVFDGGWLLPLGQEEATSGLSAVYRRLPAGKFDTVPGASAPVVVRTLTRGGRTCVYLVNDSAWKTMVTLRVAAPLDATLSSLDSRRPLPALRRDDRGLLWELELAPYELAGGWFSTKAALSDPQAVLDDSVRRRLAEQVDDLLAARAALQPALPLDALRNPGFDLSADGQPPGWSGPQVAGAGVTLDGRSPHQGERSARLTSGGPTAVLASDPFDPPRTGQLSLSVYLRVADAARQPTLRLAVEGLWDGQEYYRYAPVGAGDEQYHIGTEWTWFVFRIPDLPPRGLSQLRVRFDLLGEGEVWIDSVRLNELELGERERKVLDTRIIAVTVAKLTAGELAECQNLLDGYWPRLLVATAPPDALARRPAPAPVETSPPAEPKPPEEASKPTWLERLRESWRF